MRVFVTGATGVIGRLTIPMMVERGHRVTAVGRSPARLAEVARAGAATLTVDLFDEPRLAAAMAGHDAVVNVATHIPVGMRAFMPGAWAETGRLRKLASASLVDAALAAGVGRFVQESFAPIYEDGGDRWLSEDAPVRPGKYNRTVLDAEASVARFARSGGTGVALRFALLYGRDDGFTRDLFKYAKRGWFPIFGRPEGFVSMVSHEDVASAVVAALESPGGIYNVVDDEPLTRRALAEALGGLLTVRPPRIPPVWVGRLAGSLGETIARSLRVSNRKLRDATRWAPKYPNVRTGWRAALEDTASRRGGTPSP